MENSKSKFKMRRVVLSCTFILVLAGVATCLLILRARSGVNGVVSVPAQRMFVVEWDVVSPNEADIPKLSKMQLLSEIEKSIKRHQAFRSWEAKYRVMSRQAPQRRRDRAIPEIIISSQVHMISNDTKWFYEKQQETKNKAANENSAVNTRFVSNGEVISIVWPDRKNGQIQNSEQAVSVGSPTLADFLPSLPTELLVRRPVDFPEVLDIFDDPDTKLLPWYTRFGDQMCYVLERTTTLRQPVFRNGKELERWKRENPEKAEAWSKAARYGLVFNIYPQGQPGGGDTRVSEMKFRLAIAPKLDFAIVCWAYGYGSLSGAYRGFIFPDREIKYGDFRKVSKDLFIPHQMVYTKYRFDRKRQRFVANETRLTVEEFTVNKQYQPKLFEFDFPKGYNIIDTERGIIYTVGDSKEKIDALVTAAKARDAFYKKLSQTQAPSLEPNKWINSAPIVLTEQKGRPIILHFWSLGCAPSMHELPMLQRQYGHSAGSPKSHLFVSIHPFADGQDMRQLKRVIKKYGITFPVMVDSSDPEIRSWGKTFKRYRVFSVPTEVRIDQNGYFAEIDKEIISTNNWWMENPDISNALYDKEK